MGCMALVGKGVHDVQVQQQAKVVQQDAAPIENISFAELEDTYAINSKKTDIQKNEIWKNYQGKKVKWSGEVASISDTFGTLSLQVKIDPGTMTSDVLVDLKPSQRDAALKLSQGSKVTFVGVLDSWGTIMPITLSNGEIVTQ